MSVLGRTLAVVDTRWGRSGCASEWDFAVELANAVADGRELPVLTSPVLLDCGEVLHGDVTAEGWRFHGADVSYGAPRAVAFGGPLMFGLVAASSAAARPRTRQQAEVLAAPQWRPLGPLRILATNRRLLVWHESAWASVWHAAIREFRPDLETARLDLTFDDDPPYHLAGPWVPLLTVIVTTILARDRGVTAVSDVLNVSVNG